MSIEKFILIFLGVFSLVKIISIFKVTRLMTDKIKKDHDEKTKPDQKN